MNYLFIIIFDLFIIMFGFGVGIGYLYSMKLKNTTRKVTRVALKDRGGKGKSITLDYNENVISRAKEIFSVNMVKDLSKERVSFTVYHPKGEHNRGASESVTFYGLTIDDIDFAVRGNFNVDTGIDYESSRLEIQSKGVNKSFNLERLDKTDLIERLADEIELLDDYDSEDYVQIVCTDVKGKKRMKAKSKKFRGKSFEDVYELIYNQIKL